MKFLEATRVKSYEIISDTTNYFRKKFRIANLIFSYASAYGQIILAVTDIIQVFFIYLQDVAAENNILQAKRVHSIYGWAKISGHDPLRGVSAQGDIALSLKPNYPSVYLNTVYLYNYMKLKCNENGLTYLLDLNTDLIPLILGSNIPSFRIIEGLFEVQFQTGTGEDYQSFNIKVPAGRYIEHYHVFITVNGERYEQVESIYDLTYGSKKFVCKTGLKGGIDVFFGRSSNSIVPPLGSEIRIDYLLTNGSIGTIDEFDKATFVFEDPGYNVLGSEIDLNDYFNISVVNKPQFGADPENVELTTKLISLSSRNQILHDAKSIKYYFTKMNLFSFVDVQNEYDDAHNAQFVVTLIPDITSKLSLSNDCFNLNLTDFLLSRNTRNRLLTRIENSGDKSIDVSIDIENVTLKRYVVYLVLNVFKNYNNYIVSDTNVKRDIKNVLNNYLSKNIRNRHNVIPHSDIVRIVDEIEYIDSVKAVFVGEENELVKGNSVGFDSLGNIEVKSNELPLIRGGWSDRNGVFYEDTFDILSDKPQSVNFVINYI